MHGIEVTCHRDFNAFQSNAHHVSYLTKSEVDSKGVHHVKRVSPMMGSGSAECVAPETPARNIPLLRRLVDGSSIMRQIGTRGSLVNMECVLHSWVNESFPRQEC